MLVVTGAPATGKTWTWHLISHVLESLHGQAPTSSTSPPGRARRRGRPT
ncbi:hypothetical protein ACFQ60_08395 [Streptomyces zhihengii]